MLQQGWTTGDRRADVLPVLFLISIILVHGITDVIVALGIGGPASQIPPIDFSGVEELFATLWNLVMWFWHGVGWLIPLAIGIGSLFRVPPPRVGVLLITLYMLSYVLVSEARAIEYIIDVAPNIGMDASFLTSMGAWVLSDLGMAILPVALTCFVYFRGGVQHRTPARRWAALLTRTTLIAGAATILYVSGIQAARQAFQLIRSGDPQDAISVADYFIRCGGAIGIGICGLMLIQNSHFKRGALWATLIIMGTVTLIAGGFVVLDVVMRGGGGGESVLWGVIRILWAGWMLPILAVFLWYWWPILSGRIGTDLSPTSRFCNGCGYNLQGNVSGRCPECGLQLMHATTDPQWNVQYPHGQP